ncbi:MAG: hypothetical protein ABEJ02_02925 [Candidatus Paceibacteria bacterium]
MTDCRVCGEKTTPSDSGGSNRTGYHILCKGCRKIRAQIKRGETNFRNVIKDSEHALGDSPESQPVDSLAMKMAYTLVKLQRIEEMLKEKGELDRVEQLFTLQDDPQGQTVEKNQEVAE